MLIEWIRNYRPLKCCNTAPLRRLVTKGALDDGKGDRNATESTPSRLPAIGRQQREARARAREAAARASSRDAAHSCEALAHAIPSPFLPLHLPRQSTRVHRAVPQTQSANDAAHAASGKAPRSFFRRPLSEATVAFSSERGRSLLGHVVESSEGGDVFLDVMAAFEMQRHPVSCGLASLCIALNVLKLAPWREQRRSHKTASGWEEEFEMVTEDELNRVLLTENEKNSFAKDGVSMQDLAEVALRIEGVHVERQHAEGSTGGGFSADEFRKAIISCTSGDAAGASGVRKVMILNFSRPSLGQTGSGHFSPVAAWHAGADMALVLDTARFKYPPFWAPVDRLFTSCSTRDADTDMSRGFLLLSKCA